MHDFNKRYIFNTLAMLFVFAVIFSSCTRYYYGSASNKAFCKPLEREYRSYERMLKKNYGNDPNQPYRLVLSVNNENGEELDHAYIYIGSGNSYRYSYMIGKVSMLIADSQFVKKEFHFRIVRNDYPNDYILRKKDFKDNYLDTTLIFYYKPVFPE
ncbi:MAG TPA: hypothetical protein P5050_03100 [Bacteroidia bacterium]|nr:hypothetical protein [Bacteroidia bacterium]HRS58186.1 hypothetical protein [Bacteroidia bacterium]HRU69271.1 hypothetical protein [Bacteroidia bacterium]